MQVLLDAALRHARAGNHMPYAVYAAAKLSRPEYIRPLCDALAPAVADMDARDLNNIIWAAAACRIVDLDFGPLLARMQLLLEAAAAARARRGQPPPPPPRGGSGGGVWDVEPQELPAADIAGWQIAQTAWALPHLKVDGSDTLLRMLVASVTYASPPRLAPVSRSAPPP